MYILLSVLCVLFAIMIMVTDKQSRFLIFLVGITFLPYGFEITSKLLAPRILVFAFLASVMLRGKELHLIGKFPQLCLLSFVLIAHLLTGIFDARLSFEQGTFKAFIAFMESFGGILLGYASFSPKENSRRLLKCLISLSLIVGVYSLICFVIKADPVSSAINGGTDSMNDDRHRIASFFFNSHMAGFAMSIYIIVLLYLRQKFRFTAYQNAVAVLMFVALMLTKSRSSLLDLAAGCLVLYSAVFFQSTKKMKYIGMGFVVLLVLYVSIGQTVLAQFSDAFKDDGGETGGSNMAMRLQQLAFSWDLFLQSPWFGNGINYFWEYIKVKDNYLSSMLLGAESYIFILLIERGAIQIVCICLYFLSLYRFFIKRKSQESNLCMALLTAFLVNSIVTGNTYKWIFVMPFIGYYMRYVQLYVKPRR